MLVDVDVPELGDFALSSLINRSVRVLSQWMINGSLNFKVIALNSLLMKIASFAVWEC
jgi:hypothetical protein